MKNETSGKQGKILSEKELKKVTGGSVYDYVKDMEAAVRLITSDNIPIFETDGPVRVFTADDEEYILSFISNSYDGTSSTYLFRSVKNTQTILSIRVTKDNPKTDLIRFYP